MTKHQPKRPPEVEGAPSVVESDQTSFEDDEPRRGKHLVGGRKVVDLPHVGVTTPEDPGETPSDVRERRRH